MAGVRAAEPVRSASPKSGHRFSGKTRATKGRSAAADRRGRKICLARNAVAARAIRRSGNRFAARIARQRTPRQGKSFVARGFGGPGGCHRSMVASAGSSARHGRGRTGPHASFESLTLKRLGPGAATSSHSHRRDGTQRMNDHVLPPACRHPAAPSGACANRKGSGSQPASCALRAATGTRSAFFAFWSPLVGTPISVSAVTIWSLESRLK